MAELISADDLYEQLLKADPKKLAELVSASGQATQCFIPSPGPQTVAYYSPADLTLYGGMASGGKLIRLSEKIVTPDGFKLMGDIAVGDVVIDKDGNPCRVTALSEIDQAPELWKFTFDDGTEVVSCIDHQWLTYSAKELSDFLTKTDDWRERRRAKRPSRAKAVKTKSEKFYAALLKRNQTIKPEPMPLPTGSVRTTREIINTLTVEAKGRRNHAIPLCVAPDFPERGFIVPPYTLGAWLGDGTAAHGGFTGIDPEIWERIEFDGFEVRHSKGKKKSAHHIQGLRTKLREIGVLGNKHIPQEYLRGSRSQRLALLQGLMDTDGTIARCSGSAEFCNTNEAIVDGVCELIASLGWKVSKRSGRAKLYGRDCGKKWTLKFLPDDYVFHLPRKRNIQGLAKNRKQKFRYIESVEPVESEAGRCIMVDSPSHTYLVGEQFLVTHNSALLVGLALTAHLRSLIMRPQYTELTDLIDKMIKFYGTRDGFSGSSPPSLKTKDGRFIQYGACANPGDEFNWQGAEHDLKGFDEVVNFREDQVRFIMTWNRTSTAGQRVRTIFASNPPVSTQGDWIIPMFRPWLDVTHPNPAKDGELRWFVTDKDGKDIEVADSNPIEDGYKPDGTKRLIIPKSRTFIRSSIDDNPYADPNYKATLDAMKEPYRSAMRDGNFMMARKDSENQLIPTAWVREAQNRWTEQPPAGVPMCAIGVDPAAGGDDETVLAPRYDGYYPNFIVVPGKDTPYPQDVASKVMRYREDGAIPIVDCGGGYGGGVVKHLLDNGIEAKAHKGAEKSSGRSKDRLYAFASKRAEVYWRFMEALDPSQAGGSSIILPPDQKLMSDLCSVNFTITSRGIQLETKAELKKRLGRSPDRADAVVIAWSYGATMAQQKDGKWQGRGVRNLPKAIMGHMAQRRLR